MWLYEQGGYPVYHRFLSRTLNSVSVDSKLSARAFIRKYDTLSYSAVARERNTFDIQGTGWWDQLTGNECTLSAQLRPRETPLASTALGGKINSFSGLGGRKADSTVVSFFVMVLYCRAWAAKRKALEFISSSVFV